MGTPRTGPNISFAGCGFLGIYHVGASACLKTYAPQLLENKIFGASAGAMTAVALISGIPLGEMASHVIKLANNYKLLGMNVSLKEGWVKLLPDDIAAKASGRLFISMTKVPIGPNVLVSEYHSKSDLIDALLASSFVPMFSGLYPPKFRGELMMDGGYSDNLPVLTGQTITVSPFAGDASICPIDESQIGSVLNLRLPQGSGASANLSKDNCFKIVKALAPPNTEGLLRLCNQGYHDAMRYLQTMELIKCAECGGSESTSNLSYRVPENKCDLCDVIKKEAETKTLPLEIREVFDEEIEKESKWPRGLYSSIFSLPSDFLLFVRITISAPLALCRDLELQSCPFVGF